MDPVPAPSRRMGVISVETKRKTRDLVFLTHDREKKDRLDVSHLDRKSEESRFPGPRGRPETRQTKRFIESFKICRNFSISGQSERRSCQKSFHILRLCHITRHGQS